MCIQKFLNFNFFHFLGPLASSKYFGLQLQLSLIKHPNSNRVKGKLKKRLTMFSSLRHVASIQTKKHIAVGIFQSVMSYCLPLFGGCDKGSIKELQVLQNSAVRVVLNAHPRTSRSDLFEQV